MFEKVTDLLPEESCFPGREGEMIVSGKHLVLGNYYVEPFPSSVRKLLLGMGCFWGAERLFWQLEGVYATAVGYAGGVTRNPSYEEVCSGYTNHTEVVLVAYEPHIIGLETLLRTFWEGHDPTQGMRQGNDVGTQYRSAIYVDQSELKSVQCSRDTYQQRLSANGRAPITTEVKVGQKLYYAEEHHQQYLHKNPGGYCGLGGCGVTFTDTASQT